MSQRMFGFSAPRVMKVLSEFLSFVASACRLICAYLFDGLDSIYCFSSMFSSLSFAIRSWASRSYCLIWQFSSSKKFNCRVQGERLDQQLLSLVLAHLPYHFRIARRLASWSACWMLSGGDPLHLDSGLESWPGEAKVEILCCFAYLTLSISALF